MVSLRSLAATRPQTRRPTVRSGVTLERRALTHLCCLSLVAKRGFAGAASRKPSPRSLKTGWDDWPITGPRTFLWCVRFILSRCTSPEAHHSRCFVDTKLDLSARSVSGNHALCLCYVQLERAELACTELLARRAQMIELKYKDRALLDDSHLYFGTSETQGSLMVCPALDKYVGEELHPGSLPPK